MNGSPKYFCRLARVNSESSNMLNKAWEKGHSPDLPFDPLDHPRFCEVILPIKIENTFTYFIPHELWNNVAPGKRVIVQFARRKFYAAIVHSVHENKPVGYTAKPVSSVLDDEPLVFEQQFKLWEWIAEYYMCTLGEVMNAALPAAFKLASETRLLLNPETQIDQHELNDQEFLVAEALSINPELSIEEIQKILNRKTVYPIINSLIERRIAFVSEEIKDRYKPKLEIYVHLNNAYKSEERMKEAFELLSRAPKQLETLMAFIHLNMQQDEITKKQLGEHAKTDNTHIKKLNERGILEFEERPVGRLSRYSGDTQQESALNSSQTKALQRIEEIWKTKSVVLLHGVTSSGKTEVYIHLIKQVVDSGKQALYLLPEIALTAQIILRLQKIFGDKIGIYHSRFSNNERIEIWKKVINKEYQVLIGARSALLLPFVDLGLMVIDEEHDNSFKQFDPAPRYNARDTAIYYARLFNAKVLMGTATPSLESYRNALDNKYGLAEMMDRYGGIEMPQIEVIDIAERTKKRQMKSHFSPELLEAIGSTINNHKQVILFQNRRGFAPVMVCRTCGWSPKCNNCDVNLTYHKVFDQMKCHYCGSSKKVEVKCLACGGTDLQLYGFGTEKIEDELGVFFPQARIARMDYDATRTKHGHHEVIIAFQNRQVDILVGTQMVTKGLDFDYVSLVGILNADQLMNFPFYRAHERAYQLMEQVSGRAGRKKQRGMVMIQTFQPAHHIIGQVVKHDYEGFFKAEMSERKQFRYPPFYRIIELTLKHKKLEVVKSAAQTLTHHLKQKLGERVIGPTVPGVGWIRNQYLMNVMVKIEKEPGRLSPIKKFLKTQIENLTARKDFKSVGMVINVDP